MKKHWKLFALVLILVTCVFVLAGCSEKKMGNRIVDGKDVQTFTYAYVVLGGKEVVKGYITQWRDYNNSDVVQVLIDGRYYLTHYTNVVLIADPSQGALAYGDTDLWGDINE